MRKKIAVLLTLALAIGTVGCGQQGTEDKTEAPNSVITEENVIINDTEESTESDTEAATEEEAKEEETPSEDKVTITFDGKNDDRYNENGDLILYVYYVHPVVTIHGNEEATKAIAAEFEDDENMFYTNCESMEEEAKLLFADGLVEDMSGLANEVRYTERRVDSKVASFTKSNYSYNGGAHGTNYTFGWNFDLETGKRLTLEDIAEDKDAFMAGVKEYVLELCKSDAYSNRLFPDYEENIDFILQDDLWYFDAEGITFIANTYEISAYAEGTLFFTVPYEALDGLKDAYSYDGGFQKSVSLGERISMDLNGDGTADEVLFDAEETSDYSYTPKLTINGADYSKVFEDNQIYFAYPYEKYVILDIDGADDSFEIAVQDYGMSDDPMTAFFKYDGNKVIYMGYISDRISDLYIVNDGNGKLHARERMHVFETVNMKTTYEVENDELVRSMKDMYPIAYTDASGTKGLLQDLYVFKDMSTDSEVVKLDKGTKVTALATDNVEWVKIRHEDGNIYYIHVVNHYMIDMNGENVDSRDVFDNIIQAG